MPYGYYKCDECGVESEKAEGWQGTGRYCINHAKCFCNNNKLLPFINLEEKPMKLEATSTFPKTMADVLDGAPKDCAEFRAVFIDFSLSLLGYRNLHIGESMMKCALFEIISQPDAIKLFDDCYYKPALDYAIKKGWVRYKKEPRVIDVGRGERVTMVFRRQDGFPETSWSEGNVERLEIE